MIRRTGLGWYYQNESHQITLLLSVGIFLLFLVDGVASNDAADQDETAPLQSFPPLSAGLSLLTTGGMSSPNASDNTVWVGWSFCNQANEPDEFLSLNLPSPRRAICPSGTVTQADNDLRFPQFIPNLADNAQPTTRDEYARAKEVYLSRQKCQDSTWAVMFKSGNMDHQTEQLCQNTNGPGDGEDAANNINNHPLHLQAPFNNLPMNQPLMVHATVEEPTKSMSYSYFAGTYDVDPFWSPWRIQQVQAALHQYTRDWMTYTAFFTSSNQKTPTTPTLLQNASYLFTGWTKRQSSGLVYTSMIQTSESHPWLMNYLRANDHSSSQHPVGFGGYPWKGAGNLRGPVVSPPHGQNNSNEKLVMNLRMKILQEPALLRGLFYMPELGGCWKKSDGSPCDPGDDNLEDNLTRYLCFGVSPKSHSPCSKDSWQACPPWHYSYTLQEWVSARNTSYYPYECYHLYCGPYNDKSKSHKKHSSCDPYSNPIPQELVQVKTCQEWGYYGFPTQPLRVGQAQTWHLNLGDFGNAVYFYDTIHNNGETAPTKRPQRQWISFEVGPEVGVGSPQNPAEAQTTTQWQVSEWDVRFMDEQDLWSLWWSREPQHTY